MAARRRHLRVRVEGGARRPREAAPVPRLREHRRARPQHRVRPRARPAPPRDLGGEGAARPGAGAAWRSATMSRRSRPEPRRAATPTWIDVCARRRHHARHRRRARCSAGCQIAIVRVGDGDDADLRRRQLRPVQPGVRASRAASSATAAASPRSPRRSSSRASTCAPASVWTTRACGCPSYPTRVRDGRVAICSTPDCKQKPRIAQPLYEHLTDDRALRNASAGSVRGARSRAKSTSRNQGRRRPFIHVSQSSSRRAARCRRAPAEPVARRGARRPPPPAAARDGSAAAAAQPSPAATATSHAPRPARRRRPRRRRRRIRCPGSCARSRRSTCSAPTPPSRSTTTASGASGSTVATMLLASYKVTPSLAPMVRLGVSQNDAPATGADGTSFVNPIVGRHVREEGRRIRWAAFLGATIPIGSGGGNTPDAGARGRQRARASARARRWTTRCSRSTTSPRSRAAASPTSTTS